MRVLGMVNATPDVTEHPWVVNGYSDLLSSGLLEETRRTHEEVLAPGGHRAPDLGGTNRTVDVTRALIHALH